jgi:YidC/Oxa1 family membrane protein insertase
MNFDRNTVIGFVALAILFFGYFYYNSKEQAAYQKEKAKQDSIAAANAPKPLPTNTTAGKQDSLNADSIQLSATAGDFDSFSRGGEKLIAVENDVLKIAFSNKGGVPKTIELKQFKAPDSSVVKLSSSDFDKLSYRINTSANQQAADISSFYFTGGDVIKNADGSQIVNFQLQANGRSISHQYVIPKSGYMIDLNIQMNGISQLLTGNALNFTWQNRAVQLQKDLSYEKQQSVIAYRTGNDYDSESAMSDDNNNFDDPINWVAVKQQFFSSALIAKNNFSAGSMEWKSPKEGNTIVQAIANLKMQLPAANSATIPLSLYYGPTDYKLLKQYGNDMENMVNLGSGIFAFVKYINRWIVIPVFDIFKKVTTNYGIVILLLTLVIRLLISPLTYKSYLSGAKMKVLRPEIEQLKAKHGSDQQAMSMDQMKLFREAGVNPLGGCAV